MKAATERGHMLCTLEKERERNRERERVTHKAYLASLS